MPNWEEEYKRRLRMGARTTSKMARRKKVQPQGGGTYYRDHQIMNRGRRVKNQFVPDQGYWRTGTPG